MEGSTLLQSKIIEEDQENWKNSFDIVPNTEGYELNWTMINFLNLEEKGSSFDSPTFGESESVSWYFRLVPRQDLGNIQYVRYYLHCRTDKRLLMCVNCTWALLNKQGCKMEVANEDLKFNTVLGDRDLGSGGKWARTRVIRHYLHDGCLSFYSKVVPKVIIDDEGNYCNFPKYFISNMTNALECGPFCDFTIYLEDKEIKVNKCILIAHSSLFSTILKANKECASFRLTDEYPLVQEMLLYMYTGESPNAEMLLPKLLRTAGKFRISGLMQLCADVLSRCINVKTAAEILLLAKYYHLERLVKIAIDFINMYRCEVMKTKGWDEVVSYDAWVLTDVLDNLSTDPTFGLEKTCITVSGVTPSEGKGDTIYQCYDPNVYDDYVKSSSNSYYSNSCEQFKTPNSSYYCNKSESFRGSGSSEYYSRSDVAVSAEFRNTVEDESCSRTEESLSEQHVHPLKIAFDLYKRNHYRSV